MYTLLTGELSANRKAEYNDLLTEYRKLLDYARQFSEILNVPMPVLPVEEVAKSETTVIDELLLSHDERFPLGIWEDEETQRFYESLSDLHVFLPQLPIDAAKQKRPSISEISEEILDEEIELPAEEVEEEKKVELEHEVEAVGDTKTKYIFNDFLVHLPSCCNRDTVDNMAIEFVLNLNTKHNQKKLAKYLFGVNRTRLDLLPFYSRLVATIHPVAPDVASKRDKDFGIFRVVESKNFVYTVCLSFGRSRFVSNAEARFSLPRPKERSDQY